ncbi:MAG: hypothetical protein P8X95_04615 [Anaerolineales bacterium]|jgi:hypothetical protein
MRKFADFGMSPVEDPQDRVSSYSFPTRQASSSDYLLEAVERAMDRDPEQDFDLLLVLERKRD